jgi:hypothetical protein
MNVPMRGACMSANTAITRVDCICMQLDFEQINVLPCMSLELSKSLTKTGFGYIECLILERLSYTRFHAVNHGLHVKDKRVRVFSVYYLWAV